MQAPKMLWLVGFCRHFKSPHFISQHLSKLYIFVFVNNHIILYHHHVRQLLLCPLPHICVKHNSSRAFAVFERGRPFGARNFVCTFVTLWAEFWVHIGAESAAYSGLWLYIYIYIYSVLYYSFRLQHYTKLCLHVLGPAFWPPRVPLK